MPNQFVKDATALYHKMRKTNKNYKFSNALKDASAQRKKNMSRSTKTMKRMEHDVVDTATTGVSNVVSNINPFKSFSSNKKRRHTKKSRSHTKRTRR